MAFSVAMATYNGAKFLSEQLASIARQSVLPAELVVCDDGSSDATLEILLDFKKQASFPVRMEQNPERLGVSDNFLRAASLCKSDWICFCDQDDVWLPQKLQVIKQLIDVRPNTQLVAHRAAIVDESRRPTGSLLHVPNITKPTFIPRLTRGFWEYPYGFTMTFRSHLLRTVPLDGRPYSSHDRWIAILASVLGETAYVPDVLALYRRHGQNYSRFVPIPGTIDKIQNVDAREFEAASSAVNALAHHLKKSALNGAAQPYSRYLDQAATAYQRYAWALQKRGELSDTSHEKTVRAARYLRLLAGGGYASHRSGGLGWRAALRDAAHLVLERQPQTIGRV